MRSLYLVTEEAASFAVNMKSAIAVSERALVALYLKEADPFPVVLGSSDKAGSVIAIKSGRLGGPSAAGVKVATYWPANRGRSQPSHGSTTLLLDVETGGLKAVVASSFLTSLRTAATDAAAIRALSRQDSHVLGVIGAGHQAWFDACAAVSVRNIKRVQVWSRQANDALTFAARVSQELGIDAVAGSIQDTAESSDILITATASTSPLIRAEWIRPGTHISAMGADAPGKQELFPELVESSHLFADSVEQSISLGEFETSYLRGGIFRSEITPLGAVLHGTARGRLDDRCITIFDSSGLAIHDVAIAEIALAGAIDSGTADTIDW